MTWKEYKDWVESYGVSDEMEFDPSVEESEMDNQKIVFTDYDTGTIASLRYK